MTVVSPSPSRSRTPKSIMVVRVAIPVPLRKTFDYRIEGEEGRLVAGQRVRVPFGRQKRVGIIVEVDVVAAVAPAKLKSVEALLDETPLLDAALLKLLLRAAAYYHHPLGEVVESALPVALRQGRPAVPVMETEWLLTSAGRGQDAETLAARAPVQAALLSELKRAGERPVGAPSLQDCGSSWRSAIKILVERGWVVEQAREVLHPGAAFAGPVLNPDQQQAVTTLTATLDQYHCHLLHGITGSGKTEVYLAVIEKVLQAGRQVLVLVPEIGLTPQLAERFRQRLSGKLAVLHSGLNETERLNAWLLAMRGQADVVLGTRSAVFTPLPRLGLIIVDEEHDASLKQQEGFRYHARDLAVMRAYQVGVPAVLGSATPSLESLHRAREGSYGLLTLPERAGSASLPSVRILDMRKVPAPDGLSPTLIEALAARCKQGEQSLVFLNRRGFAPVMMCYDCGWVAPCPRCDARMVWHRHANRLRCHHCGSEQITPETCPACGAGKLHAIGEGTEKLEVILQQRLPGARIVRLDRDSTRRKGSLDQVFAQIQAGEVDIVVGTQMLAKGHDFPNVTLVCVVNADSGLYSVDFRAPEHLFTQILQVSGRAGRADKPGEVLVQTWHPQHPLFQALVSHDYELFVNEELCQRQEAGYPPFTYLALLRSEASTVEAAMGFVRHARARGSRLVTAADIMLAEPVPAPMARRAGRYRAQLLVQAPARKPLHGFLAEWLTLLEQDKEAKKVRWSIDVDPVDLY